MLTDATVQYVQIYFISGDAPKEWGRNSIKDGPSGWSNCFVIRRPGKPTRIFIPYSCEGWEVPDDCYELAKTKNTGNVLEPVWMFGCIVRAFDGRKRNGLTFDADSACDVLRYMGMTPPGNMTPETALPVVAPTRVQDAPSRRDVRAGLRDVASICAGLAITPRQARGYLRNAKVEKPENGWVGDDKWAAMIEKTIKAEMAKEAKKKPKA